MYSMCSNVVSNIQHIEYFYFTQCCKHLFYEKLYNFLLYTLRLKDHLIYSPTTEQEFNTDSAHTVS